jgi:hypothetical protein
MPGPDAKDALMPPTAPRPRWPSAVLAALAVFGIPASAGEILPEGSDRRDIPFEVTDLKPMIPVRIGGQEGRLMFDTGTPDAIFLNRDAAPLDAGVAGTTGSAASGQTITTRLHAAPEVEIAGLPWTPPDQVRSGPFGFAEVGLGEDFMGFIGRPMVEDLAYTLDYSRQLLRLLRVRDDRTLVEGAPNPDDVRAVVAFAISPGELPTTAALLGDLPILVDFDTGDSGTIYLRPESRAALEAAGTVRAKGGQLVLTTLVLGGATFAEVPVRAVEAGGPQDFRASRAPDLLRLGAEFLSRHPSLWNFPAGTITILDPGSAILAPK